MTKPALLGNGLLVIWGDIDNTANDEEALNDWWTNEHLPERLSIEGFRRARRYYSADESSTSISKYLVCYEVSTLATLTSEAYMAKLNDPTPGTAKYMSLLATLTRCASNVVHSAGREEFSVLKSGSVGSTIVHIVISFPPLSSDKEQELRNWAVSTLTPRVLASHHSVLAVHIVQPDDAATKTGNSSKSYDTVKVIKKDRESESGNKWILLVEFAYTKNAVLKHAKSPALKESFMEYITSLGAKVESNEVYELLCVANE
ncbi:hypothetical protein NA57DRAFT_78032 [Rhizodiscina lignyota]|uniref:Uncharacterized protein n=1 Tax=Rhizodiscina lignyota TaxID=1504668 RepID=A0A9P4IB24_9PEZI|nr:hypothetical protein NA57DRAFT_78032 [Rhizodiscina lignyota]